MTKASWRYAILGALALGAALYCLTGYAMIGSLYGARITRSAVLAAEFWLAGAAVCLVLCVGFGLSSWRARRGAPK